MHLSEMFIPRGMKGMNGYESRMERKMKIPDFSVKNKSKDKAG